MFQFPLRTLVRSEQPAIQNVWESKSTLIFFCVSSILRFSPGLPPACALHLSKILLRPAFTASPACRSPGSTAGAAGAAGAAGGVGAGALYTGGCTTPGLAPHAGAAG